MKTWRKDSTHHDCHVERVFPPARRLDLSSCFYECVTSSGENLSSFTCILRCPASQLPQRVSWCSPTWPGGARATPPAASPETAAETISLFLRSPLLLVTLLPGVVVAAASSSAATASNVGASCVIASSAGDASGSAGRL